MDHLKNVEDLIVGDRVDLSTCPFLKGHHMAEFEYGTVVHVQLEAPDCVVIAYDGVDHVGYAFGTQLGCVPDSELHREVLRG